MAEAAGPSTGGAGVDTKPDDEHFVDKHQSELIKRVSDVEPILDELLRRNVIQQETHDKIKTLSTAKEKMRELISGPLKSSGVQGKDVFYEILIENQPPLLEYLKRMDAEAETMSTKKRICETLNDLSSEELEKFKSLIELETGFTLFSRKQLEVTQDIVELMEDMFSQQYSGLTIYVLKLMDRTDLVQRLIDTNPGTKEKHRPSLMQRAATMGAVKELLLETLYDLSYEEQKNFKWFLQFTYFQRSLPQIYWIRQLEEDVTETLVDVMVMNCGQKSLELTREVLMDMNRTDLMQRLSETSSELEAAAGSSAEVFGVNTTEKEKHSVEEDWPALIQTVESMESVIELLLETLKDLSVAELEEFKDALLRQPEFHRHFFSIHLMLRTAQVQDTVFLMVQICGQKCVKKTEKILKKKKKKRTNLVQWLSGIFSGSKKKHSADKHCSALIHKVATVAAVQQLLLETLNDLSDMELEEFETILQSTVSKKNLPHMSMWSDRAEIVNEMVHTYGQQSVELTREVFMVMNRTDLVQRLSKPSSGLKEEHPRASSERKVSVTLLQEKLLELLKGKHSVEHPPASSERKVSVRLLHRKLLETLKDFRPGDLEKFKHVLLYTKMKEDLPRIPRHQIETADGVQTVELMLEFYGQQSEEVIREVFNKMNRRDLVQRLSDISSGSEDKHSVDEHLSELLQKGAAITTDRERLLNVLEQLKQEEFKEFKWFLRDSDILTGLPRIPHHRLEKGDMLDVVDLMLQTYSQQSVELTKTVLMDMKRPDLVQRLSKPSSGLKEGPSRSLEHDDFGSAMQDSSDWTKLQPEVNSTDADEAPTYSLQSEAGNFECSVSGLRWVCKEKVTFKYQFCPWGKPAKRMELMSYMPAGPLMDIKVTAGKLDVVFLPHWICIDNNPEIRDKFAVLHIDDCGDVVEKVAEVTSSHVKLSEPHFSLFMVLVKFGLSVDINCYMLIYKSNKAFLTLHVYLIPCDPGLKEKLDNTYSEDEWQKIKKPYPWLPLRMNDVFILATSLDSEKNKIRKVMLIYDENPSFFEVYIENANTDFELMLRESERKLVWACDIRKGDYQSAAQVQDAAPADKPSVLPPPTQLSAAERGEDEHFVDKHRLQLIEKVSNIAQILDELLDEKVIQQEKYSIIRALQTPREKMRELYSGPVQASWACKDIFYKILEKKEPRLIDALKEKK